MFSNRNFSPRGLFIIIHATAVILTSCYYDANPPSAEKLAAYKPVIAVSVSGISGRQKIILRYSENGGTMQTSAAELYSTNSGDFYFSYEFKENSPSAALQLIIDTNLNGEDTGDLRYQSPTYPFSKESNTRTIFLTITDFASI